MVTARSRSPPPPHAPAESKRRHPHRPRVISHHSNAAPPPPLFRVTWSPLHRVIPPPPPHPSTLRTYLCAQIMPPPPRQKNPHRNPPPTTPPATNSHLRVRTNWAQSPSAGGSSCAPVNPTPLNPNPPDPQASTAPPGATPFSRRDNFPDARGHPPVARAILRPMTLHSFQAIGLPPAKWRAVERKARNSGKTPAEYVRSLIERDLLADNSFDEILRPIRQDFRNSGLTSEHLDAMIQRARHSARSKTPRARR